MGKNGKLSIRNNMYIFAVGVFFTKIMNFIFAPIYSHYFSTVEFGIIDIITTTSSLIIPIATIAITEAVLKYGIDDDSDLKKVFTTGFFITFIGILLIIAFTLIAGQFIYKDYLIASLLFFIFECIFLFLQSFARAQKNTVAYMISSIIYCIISIAAIMLLVVWKKIGVNGYFYGLSLGILAAIIFLLFSCRIWNYFSIKSVDKIVLKRMIVYSAPLVASNISYWVISGSDKYITLMVLGESSNGLLSVVHKIPTLCTLLFSIFNYAYVMSALKDHKLGEDTYEEDSKFYSELFKYVLIVLIAGSALVAILAYPITLLYDVNYQPAWIYIPLYSFGVILGAMRNYFASIYCTKEKTLKIMLIVLSGAIINALSCFLLMKYTGIGLWATAISTVLANGFIFVCYYFDSRKYLILKIKLKQNISLLLCVAVSILPCFNITTTIYLIVSLSVGILLFILNFKEGLALLKKMIPNIRRKNKNHEATE